MKHNLTTIVCLLIASLLLLTGGCKKGDPSNGDSPEITTTQTGEPTDPVSPDVTTTAPDPAPTDPAPTDPRTPAQAALDEAKAERLERFVDIDSCLTGKWSEVGDDGIRERKLLNKDGEPIGLQFDHTDVDDQSGLETYLLYFDMNEENVEIERSFYGNGQRFKTIFRRYNPGTEQYVSFETRYYDEFGWWYMTMNSGLEGGTYYEGVNKGRYGNNDPEDGFTTFYQEDYSEDGNSYSILKSYQYDKNGEFIIGNFYDSKVDDTDGKNVTEAPREDPWRQHWVDTFEECHRE